MQNLETTLELYITVTGGLFTIHTYIWEERGARSEEEVTSTTFCFFWEGFFLYNNVYHLYSFTTMKVTHIFSFLPFLDVPVDIVTRKYQANTELPFNTYPSVPAYLHVSLRAQTRKRKDMRSKERCNILHSLLLHFPLSSLF